VNKPHRQGDDPATRKLPADPYDRGGENHYYLPIGGREFLQIDEVSNLGPWSNEFDQLRHIKQPNSGASATFVRGGNYALERHWRTSRRIERHSQQECCNHSKVLYEWVRRNNNSRILPIDFSDDIAAEHERRPRRHRLRIQMAAD
jgi:hypothetical protein